MHTRKYVQKLCRTAFNWKFCFWRCCTSVRFCSHTMPMLNDKLNVSLFLALTTILHANLKNSSLHQPLGTHTLGYFGWFTVFLLGKVYHFFFTNKMPPWKKSANHFSSLCSNIRTLHHTVTERESNFTRTPLACRETFI